MYEMEKMGKKKREPIAEDIRKMRKIMKERRKREVAEARAAKRYEVD